MASNGSEGGILGEAGSRTLRQITTSLSSDLSSKVWVLGSRAGRSLSQIRS